MCRRGQNMPLEGWFEGLYTRRFTTRVLKGCKVWKVPPDLDLLTQSSFVLCVIPHLALHDQVDLVIHHPCLVRFRNFWFHHLRG